MRRWIAGWVIPGGESAISFTSLVVRMSEMREARDWTRMVEGPLKWRNSWGEELV